MRRVVIGCSMLFAAVVLQGEAAEVQVHVSCAHDAVRHRAEPVCVVMVVHGDHSDLPELAHQVKKNLEATQQITIKMSIDAEPRRTDDIMQKFNEGSPFVLYLTMHEHEAEIHGRLYNTLDVIMLQGKRWKKRPTITAWAQHIAHDLWGALMGGTSSFLSSIAYITKEEKRSGKVYCSLQVADWQGLPARVVATRPTHVLAPAWLSCEGGLSLIFSEFTPINVRLMKVTLASVPQVSTVIDVPGTLVGVSTLGLDTIVYCRSGTIWRYSYDAILHKSTHTPLIREATPCACPVACANGDILYCGEGKIKKWRKDTLASEVIVNKGFCTSPAIHEGRNLIVFSRRVKGVFQLVIKDMKTGEEREVTRGPGNKIDASFSPCGFWLVYTLAQGKKSTICRVNLVTEEWREISPASAYSMCPSWSPV